MGHIYLEIDASEFFDLTESMRAKLTPENFDRLMYRTLNEVGKHSRPAIKKAVMSEYAVKGAFVTSAIKSAQITGGGGSISCKIPLIGPKGNVGSTFAATGGHAGWNPPKYRVTAQIVKSGKSILPSSMSSYGGQPPFINTAFSDLAFTRLGKDRDPIVKVSALALPQMPLNRSKKEVEADLMTYAEKRAIHHFSRIFD